MQRKVPVFVLVWVWLALSSCIGEVLAVKVQGPWYEGQDAFSPADFESCDMCQWTSALGAFYDLSNLCQKTFKIQMQNPQDSLVSFGVCKTVTCPDQPGSLACIHVPGNNPTSSGKTMIFEQLEDNIPSRGVRLILMDGQMCGYTKKPRKTVIDIECLNSEVRAQSEPSPLKAWEGDGSDTCTYFVQFPSPYGCPERENKYAVLKPVITAVSGCISSIPRHSITDCRAAGGAQIQVHGLDFMSSDQRLARAEVLVGDQPCDDVQVVNQWTLACVLRAGTGEGLLVTVRLFWTFSNGNTQKAEITGKGITVTYKPLINYQRSFDSFIDLGVGGLTKQITELYQRAFASRSVPANVLEQLGIQHAKGILLYGPPGSGKTLLARTIAKILNTEQVQLVNAPEIMSKYVGESEKNLRGYFEGAERAWNEQGEESDLYVIIIDEIDAICKPRGKSDTSAAAAAYDSVVNQLLSKMDGLRSLHNVLVIGMTNRQELIDPALLRPGRFEIQIEIGLPDQKGRWEIFYIHTKQMRQHGYLAQDVDLHQLAANTSQYSGAEIAGLVRLATSFALDRKYGSSASAEPLLLSSQDFQRALHQTKPTYTQTQDQVLSEFFPHGFIPCGRQHATILAEVKRKVLSLQDSTYDLMETILLYGPRGVGKSGIAAHVATHSHFDCVKVVTAQSLLWLSTAHKVETLVQAFQDAHKSQFSLVILDDLHNLMEEVQIANEIKASHLLLHTLSTLLMALPPQGSRVLVIGTLYSPTTNLDSYFTGKIGLQDLFNTQMYVPNIDAAGTHDVFQHLDVTREGGGRFLLPNPFSISLRNLLKVTDCVQNKVRPLGPNHLEHQVPQTVVDNCLQLVPHLQPVTLQV